MSPVSPSPANPSPAASIVIPAHNESSTILRGLGELLGDASPDEFDVVVVCNGCTDDTANVVRSSGLAVRVIELDEPSKTAALNAGDDGTDSFPRVYLDADVMVSTASMRRVVSELQSGRVLAAAPTMHLDLSEASTFVRAYYRVWLATPYCQQGLMGVGFTGLSRQGRARFDRFPDVICDDEYVRLHFEAKERTAVAAATVGVRPPTNLRDLVTINARSRLGWYQLSQRFEALVKSRDNDYRGALALVLRHPRLWPSLPIYLYVNLAARIKAKARLKTVDSYSWERDDSSRR